MRNSREEKERAFKVAISFSAVISLVIIIFLVYTGYTFVRDIDAYIDRAQVAADREDMITYLSILTDNMEKRGMTTGHFALIFKTAANDLALHYQTINRSIERLESIQGIGTDETAYQVALDDIRGTIRELENPAKRYLFVQYWYLFLIMVGVWIIPFLLTKHHSITLIEVMIIAVIIVILAFSFLTSGPTR